MMYKVFIVRISCCFFFIDKYYFSMCEVDVFMFVVLWFSVIYLCFGDVLLDFLSESIFCLSVMFWWVMLIFWNYFDFVIYRYWYEEKEWFWELVRSCWKRIWIIWVGGLKDW